MTTPSTEPTPLPLFDRIIYTLCVVFMPAWSFFGINALEPEWQDGKRESYIALLLGPEASFFSWAVIIYSVIALFLFLLRPAHFSSRFAVRFGIYAGVVVAFPYIILSALAFPPSVVAGAWLIGLYWLARQVHRRMGTGPAIGFYILAWLAGFLVLFLLSSWTKISDSLTGFPFAVLIVLASGGPIVCFLIMLLSALRLTRDYPMPFAANGANLAGMAAWLASYTGSWAYAVYKMFALYRALPTSPPDCYIATAAAQGHRGFVGSQPVQTPGGTLWVNRQLQTLKCAELALLALAPSIHRPLRRMYDALGRPLARKLTHPLLADLAYLTLKPAELASRAILGLLIPNIEDHIANIYR